MEHSTAVLEDARKVAEGGVHAAEDAHTDNNVKTSGREDSHERQRHSQNNEQARKRKAEHQSSRQQFGSKGGRHENKRHKKGDMGRGEYFRDAPDKRTKTNEAREKRLANGETGTNPNYGTTFSKEEIDAEGRRPKRKVAVLIGYSGTGYKGMQITPSERTIEGDLFQAFIKAGAISKANADDPKKAGLVRCARTDKGVHAAGNMISLKMIVEDEDIVEKINAELSPQIRVWGIERVIGSFSCYQACDSRWYEYLIPSHAFLPPHPSSWLAKKLEEIADEVGDRAAYESRQAEVKGFWQDVDEGEIKAILDMIDEDIRWDVVKALQGEDEADAKAAKADADADTSGGARNESIEEGDDGDQGVVEEQNTEPATTASNDTAMYPDSNDEGTVTKAQHVVDNTQSAPEQNSGALPSSMVDSGASIPRENPATSAGALAGEESEQSATSGGVKEEELEVESTSPPHLEDQDRQTRLRAAAKRLRQAYVRAKRRYRIPQQRIDRIQAALSKFVGTANYHNYTIQKTFRDPSAKRHIKSFIVNPTPILIGEGDDVDKSEWLSLKVHGQSFMMHQIRKMIGMVTLLVRCGSDLQTLNDSLGSEKYSIPKVPGLGLLLERPVFDSYNTLQAPKHGREPLLFSKYEKEMEAFKQREIYQRIFREEEEKNEFGKFFNHIDNFKEPYFLYVSSKGIEATKGGLQRKPEGAA